MWFVFQQHQPLHFHYDTYMHAIQTTLTLTDSAVCAIEVAAAGSTEGCQLLDIARLGMLTELVGFQACLLAGELDSEIHDETSEQIW